MVKYLKNKFLGLTNHLDQFIWEISVWDILVQLKQQLFLFILCCLNNLEVWHIIFIYPVIFLLWKTFFYQCLEYLVMNYVKNSLHTDQKPIFLFFKLDRMDSLQSHVGKANVNCGVLPCESKSFKNLAQVTVIFNVIWCKLDEFRWNSHTNMLFS